jgi:hypothetical protein
MHDPAPDLDALFNTAPIADRTFDPADLDHLPPTAQRYLAHAIAPQTPLASAVRLRMHGAIKIKRWHPFNAEQVIVRDRGMVWRAKVKMAGTTVRGFDCFLDGAGAMQWKLFGVFPLVCATGPDITRSTAGRFAAETVWLPSLLCSERVSWTSGDSDTAHVHFAVDAHDEDLSLTLSGGAVQSVALPRWGNPEGGEFREVEFGAAVDQEGTFGGYTIPVRLRVGWYFGTERFEDEGKFFQATIDEAVYR